MSRLPRDIRHLANRIEALQNVRPYDWLPGDELAFRNLLPGSMISQKLPDPKDLRQYADEMERGETIPKDHQRVERNWRNWLSWASRAEGYVRDNDPRKFNPRRMVRDIQRGKWPR